MENREEKRWEFRTKTVDLFSAFVGRIAPAMRQISFRRFAAAGVVFLTSDGSRSAGHAHRRHADDLDVDLQRLLTRLAAGGRHPDLGHARGRHRPAAKETLEFGVGAKVVARLEGSNFELGASRQSRASGEVDHGAERVHGDERGRSGGGGGKDCRHPA